VARNYTPVNEYPLLKTLLTKDVDKSRYVAMLTLGKSDEPTSKP